MKLSGLLLFFTFFIWLSCTGVDKYGWKSITSDQWREISDTAADLPHAVFTYTNSNHDTLFYDWNYAVEVLRQEHTGSPVRILMNNKHFENAQVEPVDQNCLHERDPAAFSILVDSILSGSVLPPQPLQAIRQRLLEGYSANRLLTTDRFFNDSFFHIYDGKKEYFLKLKTRIGYVGNFDSSCTGKITFGNASVSATTEGHIKVSNLGFISEMELFLLTDEPIRELAKQAVIHKKFTGKKVYYFSRQAKVVSSPVNLLWGWRYHKVFIYRL